MDAAAHYRQLVQLGRAGFVAAAAPAALLRLHTIPAMSDNTTGAITLTLEEDLDISDEMTLAAGRLEPGLPMQTGELEVYPLVKKPGASFANRITIGRTSNNDVAVNDHSVSRLHAYVRLVPDGWVIADAGSKNGSWLNGVPMSARKEIGLRSRGVLRLGDVELAFYTAADLFGALGGV